MKTIFDNTHYAISFVRKLPYFLLKHKCIWFAESILVVGKISDTWKDQRLFEKYLHMLVHFFGKLYIKRKKKNCQIWYNSVHTFIEEYLIVTLINQLTLSLMPLQFTAGSFPCSSNNQIPQSYQLQKKYILLTSIFWYSVILRCLFFL